MKTQLPLKLEGINKYHVGLVTNDKINQLIDYLAELTEVVEGKREAEHYASLPNLALTLKEMLLGEIKENQELDSWNVPVVSVETVEAIINRLLP